MANFVDIDIPNMKDVLSLSDITSFCPVYKLCNTYNGHGSLQTYTSVTKVITKKEETNARDTYDVEYLCGDKILKSSAFIKCSFPFDIVKYLTQNSKQHLPNIDSPENCASYIDGFFNYCSSILLNEHKFVNSIDFYGMYMGIHKELLIDIIEDFSYLANDPAFERNNGMLYTIQENISKKIINSRGRKPSLNISDRNVMIDDIETIDILEKLSSCDDISVADISDVTYGIELSDTHSSRSSSCSSRTSHTNSNDSDVTNNTYSTTSSTEESINIKLYDVPSCIIIMEKCENTLESLLKDNDIALLTSMLFQVTITLAAYQKAFKFTHNDLHCNNVMYVNTDKQYLYYAYNHTYYKVPTYGKIFKIIDFDRAIYTYDGDIYMGDCYEIGSVASKQYNWGKYMIQEKPEIPPNYSFDLCRFACSLYDYVIEDDDVKCPFKQLIVKLCLDDSDKSVLYKSNDVERYPDFKLYKMIARKVHNHTPDIVLKDTLFDRYRIAHSRLNRKTKIMNIDKIPELWKKNI